MNISRKSIFGGKSWDLKTFLPICVVWVDGKFYVCFSIRHISIFHGIKKSHKRDIYCKHWFEEPWERNNLVHYGTWMISGRKLQREYKTVKKLILLFFWTDSKFISAEPGVLFQVGASSTSTKTRQITTMA